MDLLKFYKLGKQLKIIINIMNEQTEFFVSSLLEAALFSLVNFRISILIVFEFYSYLTFPAPGRPTASPRSIHVKVLRVFN